MSVVSSVDCPVCGAKDKMMEDYFYKSDEVFYHCHFCGYGNLFRELHEKEETYFICDRRCARRKFAKKVEVKKEHGLMFTGKAVLFYPIEAEFDEYSVYPRLKNNNLVWKLYSEDKELLGEFSSLFEAFEAGDQCADGPDS